MRRWFSGRDDDPDSDRFGTYGKPFTKPVPKIKITFIEDGQPSDDASASVSEESSVTTEDGQPADDRGRRRWFKTREEREADKLGTYGKPFTKPVPKIKIRFIEDGQSSDDASASVSEEHPVSPTDVQPADDRGRRRWFKTREEREADKLGTYGKPFTKPVPKIKITFIEDGQPSDDASASVSEESSVTTEDGQPVDDRGRRRWFKTREEREADKLGTYGKPFTKPVPKIKLEPTKGLTRDK